MIYNYMAGYTLQLTPITAAFVHNFLIKNVQVFLFSQVVQTKIEVAFMKRQHFKNLRANLNEIW